MATVSDRIVAADPVAAELSAAGEGPTRRDVSMPPRGRARARVPDTESDHKPVEFLAQVWADLTGSWIWTAEPMSRREVVANRSPSADRVPDGSTPMRWAWVVWMHAIAIPVTWLLLPVANVARPALLRQVLRGVVWVFQHPARSALAAWIAGPLTLMWILS